MSFDIHAGRLKLACAFMQSGQPTRGCCIGVTVRSCGDVADAVPEKHVLRYSNGPVYLSHMPEPVRSVLIADDKAFTRAALRAFIEDKTGWRVCGEASNGIEALEMANRYKPDLVLLDLLMPLANGIESASAIRSILPKTRVVIVTMFPELVGKSMARMAGIDLVIDKTKCAPGLTAAFKTVFSEASEPPSIAG